MTDEQTTFTTGQISGITWLTRTSLYRISRDFPEFLSDTAKKHTRGRRWTVNDLEILQAIRTLHRMRAGKEAIKEALKAGWKPFISSADNIESFAQVYQEIIAISEDAGDALDDVKKMLGEYKAMLEDFPYYKRRVEFLHGRMDQFEAQVRKLKPQK